MAEVAADILTGFLGSGKTTLLKHVLEHGLDGRRVAVIMNEIGDLGIDGQVISGLKAVEEMVELSNGCICCSVGTQFTLAIREILQRARPHLVVVEATGIAEPGPLVAQVRESGLALDAVITVVDAEHVLRTLKESRVSGEQIAEADFLVLNKLDLVDAKAARRAERELRLRNPRAIIFRTEHGRVDTDLLFGTSVGRVRAELRALAERGGHGHNHLEDEEVQAFSYQGEPTERFERRRFERLLARLPREIWRAKGIVHFAGEDSPCMFNFTCGRWEIDWFRPPEGIVVGSQAVFIGRRAERRRQRILGALARARAGAPRGLLARLRSLPATAPEARPEPTLDE
ncbi:MAG TPA: CobW family GTP-binding protein, partial [Planctomycetota bacterium]